MAKDDLLDNYAGVEEVSERLNIHPESVRRLIRQGKLPAIKFGNKWLVEKSTLEPPEKRGRPGSFELAAEFATMPKWSRSTCKGV